MSATDMERAIRSAYERLAKALDECPPDMLTAEAREHVVQAADDLIEAL